MSRTQAFRHISVWTEFAEDNLLLRSLRGTEEIGRPFEYDLECVTEKHDLSLSDIMGRPVDIRIASHGGERERYINGYVCETELSGMIGRLSVFRLKVVPILHYMRLTADCRIFQDVTVPDLIKSVLGEFAFSNLELRLSRTYRTWEYCVQYRETYLNFITRLIEQEGLYYYFVHEQGKHTMILGDNPGSHDPEPGAETLPYYPPGARSVTRPHVYHWRPRMHSAIHAYQTKDFDFEHPKEDLRALAETDRDDPFVNTYLYDYPGEYKTYEQGEVHARIRAEELDVGYETADAQTTSRLVCAGRRVRLEQHPRGEQNREYLIVGSTIEANTDAYDGGKVDTDGNFTFRCGFDAIPAAKPFRRACETPKPVIAGPQTAIVCGREGQEVDADEYGRVKVKFHWDLSEEVNDKTTCWIRVAQDFAGKKWGSLFMPRRGQEVIVTFLEGDPDKPIITGRVYNAENRPPYDPKALPTFSTIKTCTIDGEGFNEIRFDDKADAEQIFIHAQKDMDIRVRETERETIEHEFHLSVGGDHHRGVGGDMHSHTKGAEYRVVDGGLHLSVSGDRRTSISSDDDLTVSGTVTENVTADHLLYCSRSGVWASNIQLKATESIVITCGASKISLTPGKIVLRAPLVEVKGDAIFVTGGATTVAGDNSLVLQSGVSILLTSPTVATDAAMVDAAPSVVKANTLMASTAVISPSYTPGVGNTV